MSHLVLPEWETWVAPPEGLLLVAGAKSFQVLMGNSQRQGLGSLSLTPEGEFQDVECHLSCGKEGLAGLLG